MTSKNEPTSLNGDSYETSDGSPGKGEFGSFKPILTQSIIKRALTALTRFQNEENNKENSNETRKDDKWQPLLDLRGTLVELSNSMGSISRSPSSQFSRIGGHMHSHIQDKVRTMVSGSPHTPVSEYWKLQRSKPKIVRLLDKFAFLWGVMSLLVSEYILLSIPHYFWLWYLVFMGSMLAARFPSYLKKKWHYFLLDFCYFAQVIVMFVFD